MLVSREDVEFRDGVSAHLVDGLALEYPAPPEDVRVQAEHEILRQAQARQDPLLYPVLRQEAHPPRDAPRHRKVRYLLAVEVDLARIGFDQSGQCFGQFLLAVPRDARHADDQPPGDVEADVLERHPPLRRGAHPPDGKRGPPLPGRRGSGRPLALGRHAALAHHHLDEPVAGGLIAGDGVDFQSPAEHGNPVAVVQNLLDLVRDEDDRQPPLAKDFRMENSPSTSWGVSMVVGSSRIRMSAPWYRAFRISTFC